MIERGSARRQPFQTGRHEEAIGEAKLFGEVAESLENCAIVEAVSGSDQERGVMLIEEGSEDLGRMADAPTEPWIVQDLDNGPSSISKPQPLAVVPLAYQAPGQGLGIGVSDHVVVVEQAGPRFTDSSGHRLRSTATSAPS